MKKLLFGLGTVAAVVAPVVSVVACNDDKGSSTETKTGFIDGFTVKNSSQLESALTASIEKANTLIKDVPELFTVIGGIDGTDLNLDVFKSAAGDVAILVKGSTIINHAAELDTTNTAAKLLADFAIKANDLETSSFAILVKGNKVTVQDVIAKEQAATTIGLSKDADSSFSIN